MPRLSFALPEFRWEEECRTCNRLPKGAVALQAHYYSCRSAIIGSTRLARCAGR